MNPAELAERVRERLPETVLAHTPIEMTHLGSTIWSYTCRSTGAIFCETRPATIIKSA